MSEYIIIITIFTLCWLCIINKVNAYDAFIVGVKDALKLFINIFPSLLAMMFCVELLQISHIFDYLASFITHFNTKIPSAIIPMIFFRPISGNASLAIMINIFETSGINSLSSTMASVIQGATDTTFYVISLYFSVIGIKKIKHTLWLSLLADFCAISMAIFLVIILFS